MHKFLGIFIFLILFLNSLAAKEPFLATLIHINSNAIQTFRYENTDFICKAHGVTALDEIFTRADEASTCKKSIELFYKKQRNLRFFTHSKLKIYQLKKL